MTSATSPLASYFNRYGFCPPAVAAAPAPGLGLIVVVPCSDEPDLLGTLEALRACRQPTCAVEVIVVVNAAEDAPPEVLGRNARSVAQAEDWAARNRRDGFRVHVLSFPALPAKHAGVGLARKIGMDEALARLHRSGSPVPIIANLDADCRCEPNYLVALESHFRAHAASEACAIHFEHRVEDAGDARLREGIVNYELFLRAFTLGLKFCGYPFAYHTLGSCMAVRAEAYRRQGGMNRRQAGEDFYFLNKFMTLGTFSQLNGTTVFPSPRPSHRVPFGTGRAMRRWLADGGAHGEDAYDPRVFAALRPLLDQLDGLFELPADRVAKRVTTLLQTLPPAVAGFLAENDFAARLVEIGNNSASPATFRKRFFRWFDRFRVLKYVHFASEKFWPRIGAVPAVAQLLEWKGLCTAGQALAIEPRILLAHARRMEREGAWLPLPSQDSTTPDSAPQDYGERDRGYET